MRREIRNFRYIMFHQLDYSRGVTYPREINLELLNCDLQLRLPNVEIANPSFGEVHSPLVDIFYINSIYKQIYTLSFSKLS